MLLLPSLCAAQTVTPPQSKYFSTFAEERYSTYQLAGDGDLWPSCWAADDDVYAANGDGTAFTGGSSRFDMAVSRISGMPPGLTGTTVATNVGTNWSGPNYNRKPTGMLCRNGAIYLAFQNLNFNTFDDAPAASIAKSIDQGATWTWTPLLRCSARLRTRRAARPTSSRPSSSWTMAGMRKMLSTGMCTPTGWTITGARKRRCIWRGCLRKKVQTRAAWEFYTGTDTNGAPTWTSDITQKMPVLTDTRLLYPVMFGTACPPSQQVIAQGGVTYDARAPAIYFFIVVVQHARVI